MYWRVSKAREHCFVRLWSAKHTLQTKWEIQVVFSFFLMFRLKHGWIFLPCLSFFLSLSKPFPFCVSWQAFRVLQNRRDFERVKVSTKNALFSIRCFLNSKPKVTAHVSIAYVSHSCWIKHANVHKSAFIGYCIAQASVQTELWKWWYRFIRLDGLKTQSKTQRIVKLKW